MKPDTLLLRQIHPSFIQDGRVTSQAFRLVPRSDRGSQRRKPADSARRLRRQRRPAAGGSYSVTPNAKVQAASEASRACNRLLGLED